MKTILKILFLYGIVVLTAFGCKDNKNLVIPEDRLLEVKNLIYDGCKSDNLNLMNMDYENANEYIELQSVDSNYLEIKHVNVLFNCVPAIIIQAKVENGIIIYNETDTAGISNCVCLFDLSSNIGPLDYAQYTFGLNRAGERITEFDFNFSSSTQEIFKIDKKNYYENNK